MATLARLQAEHGCEGDVQMWTLTVDPSRYSSPEEAWQDVTESGSIARTWRKVGCRYWVWVLEWHKSGWPHWHVLVWEPVKRMYLNKADVERHWGHGVVWYTCRHRGSDGQYLLNPKPLIWAVRYLTKYLTKSTDQVPEWVLARSRVRMIQASQPWGPVRVVVPQSGSEVGTSDDLWSDDLDAAPRRDPAAAADNQAAIASCGGSTVILERVVDRRTGEVRERFLDAIPVPFKAAQQWVRRHGVVSGSRTVLPAVDNIRPLRDWVSFRRKAADMLSHVGGGVVARGYISDDRLRPAGGSVPASAQASYPDGARVSESPRGVSVDVHESRRGRPAS